MKRFAALLLCILLLCLPLAGCSDGTRNAVKEYLDRTFPGKAYTLARGYELGTNGVLPVKYWTFYFDDLPEVELHVQSRRTPLRSTDYMFSNDCDYELAWYHFRQYFGEHPQGYGLVSAGQGARDTFGNDEYEYPGFHYYKAAALGDFDDGNAAEVFATLHNFKSYVDSSGFPCSMEVRMQYHYALSDGGSWPLRIHNPVSLEAVDTQLQTWAVEYQWISYPLTQREYDDALEAVGTPYTLYDEYGEGIAFEGLPTRASFGVIYHVLLELGFDVEGDAEHYRVTGADGSEYEFAYSFVSRDASAPFASATYFYYKDGNRVTLNQMPMLTYAELPLVTGLYHAVHAAPNAVSSGANNAGDSSGGFSADSLSEAEDVSGISIPQPQG